MPTSRIIEAMDVIKDHPSSFSSCFGDIVPETLRFQSGPEGLLMSVVITVPSPAHAGGYAARFE